MNDIAVSILKYIMKLVFTLCHELNLLKEEGIICMSFSGVPPVLHRDKSSFY